MRNYTDQDGFVTVRNSRPHNYWSKLPREIIITILQKVGLLNILLSAQLVCTQWREICTDPSMWATIRVGNLSSTNWTPQNFTCYGYRTHVENMIRWAVDQSCGSLFDLDLDILVYEKLINYVVERCNRIRRLGIPMCFTEDVLERVASRFPLLEDLELVGDLELSSKAIQLSSEAIETLGKYCPKLTSLKFHVRGDEEVKAIARSMPQLRHICLPCETGVTDIGVEALLDGCSNLESLDIQGSYFFKITRAFQMMKKLPMTRTQWRSVLDDPSTWSTICVSEWIFFHYFENYIIRWAVDKSCGGLVDVDLDKYMYEDILDYVTERCNRIRRLRGIPQDFTEDVLVRVASRLPLLEDFELMGDFKLKSKEIETLGRYCPKLTSLKIHIHDDEEAKTIARSMPQLRQICLSGKSFLTDVGVEALFDGCPNIESLNIRGSYFFEMTGAFQMMKNFPLTHTQWREVLENPSTWSTICLAIFNFDHFHKCEELDYIIRRAVDKSCGGLVDLDLERYTSKDILYYVVERCPRIRRLRGYYYIPSNWSDGEVGAALARLTLLEDLSLRYKVSAETIETLARCCPRLTSLEIPIYDNDEAETLARSFPKLRHLKPFNDYGLTNLGVEAILDGCPHLESLDLRECYRVILDGTIGVRCAQKIKYLRRPPTLNDPYYRRCCFRSTKKYQTYEDDLDDNQFLEEDNQFLEEDVYDVDYTIYRREEYWIRREKARNKETRTQQLRRVKGNNKIRPNRETRNPKARRRIREFRREVKKEFVHLNKLATGPCTLLNNICGLIKL